MGPFLTLPLGRRFAGVVSRGRSVRRASVHVDIGVDGDGDRCCASKVRSRCVGHSGHGSGRRAREDGEEKNVCCWGC